MQKNMQAAGKKLKKASKKHKKQQTDKTSKHIDKYKPNTQQLSPEAMQTLQQLNTLQDGFKKNSHSGSALLSDSEFTHNAL